MELDNKFWNRLHSFVADVQTNCCAGYEEKEMILAVCKYKLTSPEIIPTQEILQKKLVERQTIKEFINTHDLSIRLINCLHATELTYVDELVPKELIKYRHFGRKTLNELQENLIK